MGSWYWIGVCVGLGTAAGVLVAGVAARIVLLALAIAAGAGLAIGLVVGGWGDGIGGLVGGLAGSLGAAQVVRGALRRGGTVAGTALLVGGAALLAAGLAWVPIVGYLEAIVLPGIAARLRRRQPERYAGLRTLAK